jgi:hypothetical protein
MTTEALSEAKANGEFAPFSIFQSTARCPHCLTGDGEPKCDPHIPDPLPGQFSMCLNCGAVSAFGDDMTLRFMTPEEVAEMRKNFHGRRCLDHGKDMVDRIKKDWAEFDSAQPQ